MYIYKIIIDNFRNIEHLEWKPNEKLNVLFGHNGCGKSNIAQALNLLFSSSRNNNYFDDEDFYKKDDSKVISIEAWINKIDDLNIEEKDTSITYISPNDQIILEDTDMENVKEMVIIKLSSNDEHKMEWSILSGNKYENLSMKSRTKINFSFVGTVRNPVKELSFGRDTLLQSLIDKPINDDIKEISEKAKSLIDDEIKESSNIQDFLKNILTVDREISDNVKFDILPKSMSEFNSYNNLEVGLSNNEYTLSINRQSTGIQNLLLLTLMIKKLKGNGIVFVEELEQNLEPKNQVYILDKYKELEGGQLFVTSHSPDIIESFPYNSIFYMNKNNIEPIFEKIDEKILKVIFQVNKKNMISSLMAKRVILVEGESEYNTIPVYMVSNKSIMDYSIILVQGKENFEKYINAFESLGIKPYLLTDNDVDMNENDIKKYSQKCEKIYISQNNYEDWIYDYINEKIDNLEEYVPFKKIKNSLASVKDEQVKQEIESVGISNLREYNDIKNMKLTVKCVLHDSFAGVYYSRLLANMMAEEEYIPLQAKLLIDNLLNNTSLVKYKEELNNVFLLKGIEDGT